MNKRGAGIALIAIAAFLFATRYFSAAIFSVGDAIFAGSFGEGTFYESLDYTGGTLLGLSILACIAGVVYLLWAEINARD